MRILHVLPSLDEAYGGPVRLVLDLSARASALGLVSEVAGVNQLRVHRSPLPPSAIHSFPGGNDAGFAYSSALRGWLDGNVIQYDAVAIHGAWHYPGWAAHVACRKSRVPYAYFPHGMLERWAVTGQGLAKRVKKRLYWWFRESRIANGASRVFFTTRREQEMTSRTFFITAPQEILSVYGIEDPTPAREPLRPELRLPESSHVALYLSRLHPKKNLPFLMQCWKDAGIKQPWVLVIAGSGEPSYEAHLRQLAARLGMAEQVRFVGFVSGQDKNWLLQRAEWFLLPSSQENFGIAVLEAVANGCAVAISEGVYLAESFRPASVVLPLRREAWVNFLTGQFQDASYRSCTAAADRTYLLGTFRMDRVVEKWASALGSLSDVRTVV